MTEVFEVLVTVAVNCLVVFTRRVTVVGEMLMATGTGGGGGAGFTTVTTALPRAEGMAELLACTVTVAGDGGAAGAV